MAGTSPAVANRRALYFSEEKFSYHVVERVFFLAASKNKKKKRKKNQRHRANVHALASPSLSLSISISLSLVEDVYACVYGGAESRGSRRRSADDLL